MPRPKDEGLSPLTLRLFKLVALIAESPGIDKARLLDALEAETGRKLASSTLFKDIRTLKELGVLSDAPHRSGYFLNGASLPDEEMKVVLNALRIQGVNLRSPGARDLYGRLLKRIAKNRSDLDVLSYPVEAVGNRVTVETLNVNFRDLVETLRTAIRVGQEVVVRKVRDPWKVGVLIDFQIFPLQFIFHDTAWYLLAEDVEQRWFRVFRMDRLSPVVELTRTKPRGIRTQRKRLLEAKRLLHMGWGMAIPDPPAKTAQDISLTTVEVLFDVYAANFIRESERLHPTQEITDLRAGEILFRVRLPHSVLGHFERWVGSWGHHAEVLAPNDMRNRLWQMFRQAAERYSQVLDDRPLTH